jgi:hypothetical protein
MTKYVPQRISIGARTSEWVVESIYFLNFLKPARFGTHFAGLWPEQGTARYQSHRLEPAVCHIRRKIMASEMFGG